MEKSHKITETSAPTWTKETPPDLWAGASTRPTTVLWAEQLLPQQSWLRAWQPNGMCRVLQWCYSSFDVPWVVSSQFCGDVPSLESLRCSILSPEASSQMGRRVEISVSWCRMGYIKMNQNIAISFLDMKSKRRFNRQSHNKTVLIWWRIACTETAVKLAHLMPSCWMRSGQSGESMRAKWQTMSLISSCDSAGVAVETIGCDPFVTFVEKTLWLVRQWSHSVFCFQCMLRAVSDSKTHGFGEFEMFNCVHPTFAYTSRRA